MSHYEIMYIIPVKVTEDSPEPIQQKVRVAIEQLGGTITREELWGKRKLAYPINKVRHGTYIIIEADINTAKIQELNNWFRLSTDILRAQILAVEPLNEKQLARQQALQQKLAKINAQHDLLTKQEEASKAEETTTVKTHEKPKIKLEELDSKLDSILEQEMVK